MDSISPPNRPHYPWKQGEILIADELNAAIANAGHGTRVTDWIPGGQPDGVTDLAPYFQQAIDGAADADPADRASAPGLTRLIVPANPLPYIIGTSLIIPSHSHIIIELGATLKLAPQTNANMFLLCNFAHHVLIELYGTLDGNSSQQYFQLNLDYPATNGNPASISGGISNDRIWGGPARNPPVQGGFCSHVKIIGDRNGLITNFQNQAVGLAGATNCEVSDISLTNSAFHAGSVGVSGWRNFPYDPAAGTPLTFTGTSVAATGIVTLTTNVPHCMVPGEEFITETLTGTGGFNAATGKLFITLAGTAGNTIVYAATGGGVGTDGSITGGRITNWFYQQATIVSGTYVPATGVITVTTTAPHQLVYGQTISSNITGGTAAAVATGIFQLLDVTDGAGEPPITAAKNVTLRYRTTRTGTTENIVSGVYDAPSGTVTLTTDAPHGMSPGDVVTVSATGSGFLSGLHGEYVCVAGTTGTTIKYVGPPNLAGITISGGTVYGGPTLSITGGTIGVSTKCWNSGFDNCFIDQIRDIGPCIYGGGVACYIRNSEITRNLGSGPYLFSDANSGRCVDCEISGNYIHDNLGAGVGTVNFGTGNIPHTGTRIFNNYITGNRGGAGFGSCDGLECADNYFYKNRAVGLNTYGSVGEITVGPDANRVSITGNTLRDPCLISTTMAGTTLTQVVSGTYNNATGAVSLTTAIPHNLFTNAYFTLSATTGTGAHASIEGRYIAEASTGPTILNFHAPAGLGTITFTGGQLVPNGFGIVTHGADRLYIADNFIADYQSPPTMLAAIGGTWGIQGVCTGNYYGPRINSGGNFPADMSAGGMQGNNFDVVTGFTNGTTLHQPFSNDSAERFAPLGVQVGYNRSAGRGESNIYVGAGNASPGGFDFIKVIGISVQAPSSYDPATAIVTLTTRTPHGLVVGSRFNLSLVLGTDSIGFTDGRDISKLGGNWIATADNAGTSGTTINFVLTQNVAGVPTPYTGLDILTITAGAINASALDSGVIDTSVGLPVVVSNSGTLGFTTGGSLLSVDGYANTRLSGALVHGAIQTATLANGGTVTVPQNTSFMLVNNSSSIATGSLVLPAPAASSFQTIGSQLDVRFQNPVGTLTVTAATGAAVAGPPTAVLSAGAAFRFIQGGPGAAANTWLPCIPDVSGTPPVGGPYLALSGGAVGPGTLTVNGPFVATGSVTLPTTTTGPFLPLATGGTVAGLVNLTAAGLGLDVTGNARTRGQHIVGVAGTNNIITMTAGANQTTTPAIIQAQNSPGIAFTGGPLAANCTNFGRANTYTLSGGTIDTTLFGLYVQNGIIGNSTVPEIPGAAWINLSQANVNAPSSLVDALRVSFVAGGVAAVSGGWQALAATCSDIAPTNDKAGGGLGCFLAAQINRIASQPQGGTGLTPSTAFGNNWGIDVICTAKNGALNLYGMTGIELDNAMNTGSSVVRRAGLAVNNSGGHAVRGAMADDAIVVGQATGPPWRTGLRFGGGFSPLAPLGTDSKVLAYELSQAHTALANIGIDFNDVTFTTAALRTPGGFAVSPTGVLQLSTAFLTPTATGLSVDVVGSVGTGTPAVSAGGSGYAGLGGDILDDAYGGVYYTLASGGVVTSVTVVAQPIYPTASPPATLATTARSASTGTGCVLTPTWSTTRTTLALQPSGGTIQAGSGAWTANGATSVSLTALAPAGAHATVQEWLTIKDASGTVRYVPCF